MANIDTSKLVNLGNLQYYDQKIKNYTEEKIKGTNLSDLVDDAEHRTVTDTEKASWNAKSDFSGSYEDLSDIPSDLATTGNVASALSEAKAYTDEEIAKFDFIKVVNELPEEGLENKIYLVPIAKNIELAPGAYTADGTFSNLEYTWEQMIANGESNTTPLAEVYSDATYGDVVYVDGYITIGAYYDIVFPETYSAFEPEYCKNCIFPASTQYILESEKGFGDEATVYIKATTPPTLSNSHVLEGGLSSIVVPIGCSETYKNAEYWSDYSGIIEEGEIPGSSSTSTDATDQNLFDEWIWVNKGTEDAPEYVWEWVTTKQLEVDLTPYATTEYVDTNKVQIVTTGGTGSAYTATVPGITSLTTGVSFVMIPHVVSASTSPTLNVNGLGATEVRRHNSSTSGSTELGYSATWLSVNTPITVIYDGEYWIVEDQIKPSAADLNGTVPITKGGTNASTPEDAVANLKSALVDLIYPIGSIYMSLEDTDPGTLFGGIWQRLEDRFLIGAGGSYVVGDKGGAATVTLEDKHLPSGAMRFHAIGNGDWSTGRWADHTESEFAASVPLSQYPSIEQAQPLNNIPPYLAVYMWQRVSHEGHSVWTNADITMIPTITSNTSTGVSRTLTLSYPITIANSDYVTTNNLEYSIVWYMNGVQQKNTTATFNASKVATYSAKVTVSGTLVDSEGCISNIYKEFTSGNYILTHDGHCEWSDNDVSITPTITRTGSSLNDYVLHASYTTSINNSSYITTNNLKASYQWYKSSYPLFYETSSLYPEDYGTFKVEITVSGTLVDNAGCSSYIYKTVTASYTMW